MFAENRIRFVIQVNSITHQQSNVNIVLITVPCVRMPHIAKSAKMDSTY